MYYYVISPNVKNKMAIGKIVCRHNYLFMAKRHRTLIVKDSNTIKLLIVSSEKERSKNGNLFAEDILEYFD